MASNPRWAKAERKKLQARYRALGLPCALCGRAIDYDLGMIIDPVTHKRRPHPMSFVIDEIIPVSQGGSPFTFENTRPAHWICNSRRGAGGQKKQPATNAAPLPQPWDL